MPEQGHFLSALTNEKDFTSGRQKTNAATSSENSARLSSTFARVPPPGVIHKPGASPARQRRRNERGSPNVSPPALSAANRPHGLTPSPAVCDWKKLAVHTALSHPAQLTVDQGHQLLERAAIAVAPALQQETD